MVWRKWTKLTEFVHYLAKCDGRAVNRYVVDFGLKKPCPFAVDLGVGRVFEQRNTPGDEGGNPPRFVIKVFEVRIPGESHEDIRAS